ncbi:MAG: ABC transporter ATP-binding protein [Rhodospirillales bacterium]|nr:ABC transporter ATP-binding protein [Rhodospirillales bacterium]
MLLRVENLTRTFSGLVAVDQVSFAVEAGSVHALIGPNGAGKTTLFNMVSGLLEPSAGGIFLDRHDLSARPAHHRARLGIGRTFQNIRIFGEMSVLENVLTGAHPWLRASWPGVLLRLPAARAEERQAQDEAWELLRLVGLEEQAGRPASDLAYGDQRRLEIARALACRPRLLLLDEPAAGMNPTETASLLKLLKSLRGGGISILLVEHDMNFVMDLSDRVTVLNFGRNIAEGSPAQVRANPAVIEAYLGAKVAERLLARREAGE